MCEPPTLDVGAVTWMDAHVTATSPFVTIVSNVKVVPNNAAVGGELVDL